MMQNGTKWMILEWILTLVTQKQKHVQVISLTGQTFMGWESDLQTTCTEVYTIHTKRLASFPALHSLSTFVYLLAMNVVVLINFSRCDLPAFSRKLLVLYSHPRSLGTRLTAIMSSSKLLGPTYGCWILLQRLEGGRADHVIKLCFAYPSRVNTTWPAVEQFVVGDMVRNHLIFCFE